ncbi:probable RNA-directed DNA polymerase from transposon X-element [Trichonephila clavipes]|uniref:Probable RNA-directed DNA polymerase from transposon X-element n=1 Tax=Trichonephila clavipes TaxID=2585209 RepID=A0A8X6W678_TRICX|nr:probable RNA-directed DNA polymerase from transposon X-element [Trichonephila clavipes]
MLKPLLINKYLRPRALKASHPQLEHPNVQLVFLPPNTRNLVQPLDQVLTVDGVVGPEGDNDDEEKSTPLTGKLIQEGLQLCSKLENHFLINDPNSERASKLQFDGPQLAGRVLDIPALHHRSKRSIVNFNSQIQNAVNQASKFKPILHSMSNIPFETRVKIREKNRLRKLWQRTQYSPLKVEVNRLQRIIRADLKKSKEHVWDSLQKDANIDIYSLHKLVADNNNRNNILCPPLLGFRGLIYGTKKKADCFADNLEESFTENRTPYDDDHIDKVDRAIRSFLNNYSSSIPPLTSPHEVCGIISQLNIHKAPGHDQIKNIALKSLPMSAITHLTKIFNKCLLLQYFPQTWKHCTITLLPKKNKDPKLPLNYRPISLISCVAKLFEKILLSRIQAFSDSNHLIPDFQHGFRKKLLLATNCSAPPT